MIKGSIQEEHNNCTHLLSPCLFNLHAEYIMRNAGLEEAQAGIKTARRNINKLRYPGCWSAPQAMGMFR